MASGSAARIIRAPGRVILNPTEAFDGGTYPYGGTEIGKTKLCAIQPLGTAMRVVSEGLGEATDILEADNRYFFTCMLRGWDDDAVRLLLAAGYEAGTVTQHAVFHEPGSVTPGQSALSRSVILAYIPDDPVHVPGVLVYSGVPDWSEGAELAFQHGSEVLLPVALDCMRDTNGNILRVGLLADLSLT